MHAQIIKRLLLWFSAMIEYIYSKMTRNSPLNENEKVQISAYKLEGKYISFIARKLWRSRTVVRNYLKDPESYGTRKYPGHLPKITNAAECRLFEKYLKDNQSQEICKNLRISPSIQEEFVNFSMNSQILYTKTGRQPLL